MGKHHASEPGSAAAVAVVNQGLTGNRNTSIDPFSQSLPPQTSIILPRQLQSTKSNESSLSQSRRQSQQGQHQVLPKYQQYAPGMSRSGTQQKQHASSGTSILRRNGGQIVQ